MAFRTLDDLGDIKGKRVFVRVDLNVPMADGRVTDETRLRALLPTVSELADKGAKVLLLAHFGRPKGAKHSEMSVSMVLDALQDVLGREVMFVPEIAGDIVAQSIGILADGDIALLENTRIWPGSNTIGRVPEVKSVKPLSRSSSVSDVKPPPISSAAITPSLMLS